MSRHFVLAIAISVALTAAANAAISLFPVLNPANTAGGGATSTRSGVGTFHLYAFDTADYGIATYSISFGAAVTGSNNRSPSTTISDINGDPQSAGFTLLRSATNANPMTGGQNLPGQTPFLIKGMGKTTGSFAAVAATQPGAAVSGPTVSGSWGGPYASGGGGALFIGEGAYNTALFPNPSQSDLSQLISAATFTTYANSAQGDFAQTATQTTILPSCLGCAAPIVNDQTINNVDPNNPGVVMHTFTQSTANFATWSGFQFDSFVPGPGSSGTGPVTPATFDPLNQKFNWNSVGSPIGTYKWLVTASNEYGFDQGSLTVNVTIPEPAISTLLALGLAAVFSVGRPRRGFVAAQAKLRILE